MRPESNPYVGPRPFEQDDAGVFFGRDREVEDLVALVVSHQVVLLYAASGAGKSSLLNAALAPRLRAEEGFEVLPVARVRGLLVAEVSADANVFVAALLTHLTRDGENPTSLRDYLSRRPHPTLDDGFPAPRALVIDQLEELFTAYPERWADRPGFFAELAGALEDDPLLRVVLSIREDFVAQLDPYASQLPDGMRTRYRLERLGGTAALRAAVEPARRGGRSFSPGVAEQLVEDLLEVRVDTERGAVPVRGEHVEPVQLQVACHSLWDALPANVTEITEETRRTFGDVDDVLADFYDEAIAAAAAAGHVRQDKLRPRFAKAFITPMGTRGTVLWTRKETAEIPPAAIEELDRRHLIRAELRAGARWYELTHDRLIEPIRASNRARDAWRRRRDARRAGVGAASAAVAAGIAIAALAITSSSQSEAAGAPRPANVAKIEQVANNTLVALLRGGLGQPLSIAYTPDGSEFGVVGARASHVWTADGVPAGGLPGGRPTALAFDRTGLTVSGHANGSLFVAGAGRSKTLRLHGGAIGALVARPSGGVAVGTLSGRVFLVDPDYATVHPLQAGNAPIQSLAISRDGTLLASADAAGVVRVISATSAQVLHTNGSAKIGFVTPAFRPDGGGVYVVGSNGSVQIRGTRTDSRPIHLTPPRSDPAGIAVDPTGIMLAVYEKNGSILLLWANGSSIRRFPAAGGGIVAATFNPQGSRLAAAYADGTIRLWRTRPDLAVTKADLQVTRSAYVVNVTLENIGSIAAASTTLRVGGTEVPVPAIPPAGDFAYRRAIPRNSAEGIRLTRDRGVAIVADSSRTSLEDTFANNRRFLRLAATNVTGSGVRSKIVAAALAGVELKDRIHYNYGPQRMSGVAQRIRLPRVPAYADTSSFVTWCYWQAGAPDPNGRHYDGFGYSGTLVANGRRTASPRPGDLVFYGTNPKVPTVDGVFVGHGQVVIQASEAGPTLEPLHNKRPLLQIRTYPVSA